jgi:hypothetical protein
MTFPQRVQAALAETDTTGLPGLLALGRACVGAKFHSPNPLILHEVKVGSEALLLCGTCQTNLEVLQHLLVQNGGDLPWQVRREFGNLIRAIALQWWESRQSEDEVASA